MTDGSFDKGNWIPPEEYDEITKKIPILCIDVLPISASEPDSVGLIYRETYWGRRGWCLVGIGVQHGEPLVTAVQRAFTWALGDQVRIDPATLQLKEIVEYLPEQGVGEFFDPRKHAVALTYTCVVSGQPEPRGKAIDFKWFSRDALPEGDALGFGQERLIPRLLAR
ncbi:DUF4916 domain-containing protein [Saccharopolyspora phatthalungensis]|uniref:ADP-ribose pyrophosphatase YjhB (NUDIX family) n=1 Tax=Saccharopolyspora phatthalungensis TaxID=664693 RepID=A0A840QHH0_9PSEU|nr:DUF4916 domain-containing protein [Saccharopolyspora phatthalungensis]MBB5159611.1 ADP-ribose pyrophosphatase YjhB (NUDIX family) [Saccharopolyspora phatthalungensis]